MNARDLEITRRYANGAELKTIAADLKIDQEAVNEVVSALGFQRSRAQELLRERDHALSKARNMPEPPAGKPVVEARRDIESLLARAETAGGKFTARASRLRGLLADLERDLTAHAEVLAAERAVEQLRSQLTEATEKLRTAKGRTLPAAPRRSSTPAPPPGPIVDFKAVRRWAAENGVDCSKAGRVPNAVIKAYREATNGAAA